MSTPRRTAAGSPSGTPSGTPATPAGTSAGTPGGTARTVLVTGAGRGIGRATALHLAARGWDVHGGVRTDAAGAALRAQGVTPVRLDVTDAEDVAALAAAVPTRLDALVNNVGIAVAGPVETLSPQDMHRQLDTNLVGPLAATRAVLPALRRARGRILFVSSINGLVSFPFTGLYNASKSAVEAVADCLRVELGPFGVQVGLVEPGVVDTDPWHTMDRTLDDLEAALDPGLRELYAPHFAGERQLVARIRRGAAPPETVARAVERALVRRRVRARVLVGRDARAIRALKAVLPAHALDAVWSRGLGLAPASRAPTRVPDAVPR
ncbi:SDR family NAD(P)-dependent oxidoreductase [Cellulomonas endophytica]|uniref:SDR family NAD(P)-dependent oxidoreductase n=1 Tax=Cellulomonas endophytica TaxID=2494735 RepID=UPI0010118015|nr:SDR family NAD(P)-dependent oxidoreductase [Cellulomonas endophytica]